MKAHLVGSVGLPTVDDVFATVGRLLGRHLSRVPDGEPGGRRVWVNWQYPVFLANPFLQLGSEEDRATRGARVLRVKLADGVQPADVQFGELGYAREARSSYADFCRARDAGLFAKTTRFQVGLPTPINIVGTACTPAAVLQVEPAYHKAMLQEVDRLCSAIPHADLCIQWEMVREVLWWDGRILKTQPAPFSDSMLREEVLVRLGELCAAVPERVQLGVHLCYGDWGGKHQIDPVDTAAMTALANAVAQRAGRDLSYVHMPVPIARNDPGYFAPLLDLKLTSGTEMFLGLVHLDGGISGTRRRIATARKYLPAFGIAAECGLGRAKSPDMVTDILALHAEICESSI
jgi:hypothetical protein